MLGGFDGSLGSQAIPLGLMPRTSFTPDRNPLVLGRSLKRGDDAFKFINVVDH